MDQNTFFELDDIFCIRTRTPPDAIAVLAASAAGPRIGTKLRAVIRRMNRENPLWGPAHPRQIVGIDVAESPVSRYMVLRRRPPSQGWKTFLRNHAAGIASLDLFVVRTISFKLLYGLVILRHTRRRVGHDCGDCQSDGPVARRSGDRSFPVG
jgi:hypothetical protein